MMIKLKVSLWPRSRKCKTRRNFRTIHNKIYLECKIHHPQIFSNYNFPRQIQFFNINWNYRTINWNQIIPQLALQALSLRIPRQVVILSSHQKARWKVLLVKAPSKATTKTRWRQIKLHKSRSIMVSVTYKNKHKVKIIGMIIWWMLDQEYKYPNLSQIRRLVPQIPEWSHSSNLRLVPHHSIYPTIWTHH